MIARLLPGVAALMLVAAACGSSASQPAQSGSAGGASASPAASPQGPTPTARIADPAPSPSPVAVTSPSPAAGPSPSPVAAASPAAASLAPVASPVVAASPAAAPASSSVLFRVVSERSEARYEVTEKFVERPLPNDVVGRTKDVTGEMELEAANAPRGRVRQMQVDLRTLTSDISRRDNYVRQNTLQTDQFPFAQFRSDQVVGPTEYTEGSDVQFQIPGTMTIKGQDRPLTWDATVKMEGGRLTGTARARIKLTEFGIEPPRLAILSVEDDMTWVIQLDAERAT